MREMSVVTTAPRTIRRGKVVRITLERELRLPFAAGIFLILQPRERRSPRNQAQSFRCRRPRIVSVVFNRQDRAAPVGSLRARSFMQGIPRVHSV